MSSRSETPLKSCCKYGFKVLKIENWCLFADGAVARYTQSSVIRYLNSSSQIKESLNGQTFFLAKMYLGGYAYSEEFDVGAFLIHQVYLTFMKLLENSRLGISNLILTLFTFN